MGNGDIFNLEQEQPQERPTGLGVTARPRSLLGLLKPLPEEEEDKEGFWESFATIGLASAIEPLGIIGPIGDVVERLKEGERSGLGKAGAALGWFVGFAIPAAPAFKLGHTAAKGLGLVRAAKAGASLGVRGNLIRGGVAGALLSVGKEAESGEDRVKNVLTEAALFGIGDAALYPAWRAISGSGIIDRLFSQGTKELTEGLATGTYDDINGALRGKALAIADMRFPEEVVASKGLDKARKDLLLGIDKMELDKLIPGEVKIVPSLTANEGDLRVILAGLDDVAFEVIPHKVGGVDYADVLVSKGKKIDKRISMEFKGNLETYGTGFLRGQEVMYEGRIREVVGPLKGSKTHVKGRTIGSNRNPVNIELKYATFYPMAVWRKGPGSVRGASAFYSRFVERYGQWSERPFDDLFSEFTKNSKMDAGQLRDLRTYFAQRIRASIHTLDDDGPALAKAFSKVENAPHLFNHPEGKFTRMAQGLGYIVDSEIKGGAKRVVLRDAERGTVERFANEDAALDFLRTRAKPKRIAVEGADKNVLPNEIFNPDGSGVQVAMDAASLSGSWIPLKILALNFADSFLPRLAFTRMVEDWSINKVGKAATQPVWAKFESYRAALDQSRLSTIPWVEGGITRKDGTKVKSIIQIYGKNWYGGKKGNVNGEGIFDLLEAQSPFSVKAGDDVAKKFGLDARGVQAAKDTRTYLDAFINDVLIPSDVIDITADDFINFYMPRMRDTAESELEAVLRSQLGGRYSEKTVKFIHEMERTGQSGRYMKDPAFVLLNYTRAAFKKIHMTEPLADLQTTMRTLPNEGPLGLVKNSLQDMVDMAYGGKPEHIWLYKKAAKDVMEKTGVVLSQRDFDRFIQTMVSLNYGAFMGFRPALALRNLTQTLTVTLPIVGPKYLAHGFKFALSGREAMEEALGMSAIRPGRVTEHLQDAIWSSQMYNKLVSTEELGLATGLAVKTLRGAQELSTFAIGGGIKTRFGEIPIGLYSRMDTFNRVVSYGAQKRRILDKWMKYNPDSGTHAKRSMSKFNQEAGLNFLGPAQTREFHRVRGSKGIMEAAKWSGTQMANETQWVYQLGAGPAAFSHGIGRLFGMYGTWPSWYSQHLMRGMTRGSAIDKARFWGWTAVVHGAFATSATTIGINLSRWSPLNSLGWAGGPFFDWFVDLKDIISGAGEEGPTARRQMALAKYGLKDTGRDVPVPALGHLDPREDRGLDFKTDPNDPWRGFTGQAKLATSLLGMFTPGYLQARDMLRASEEVGETFGIPNSALRFAGLKPVDPAGRAWPRGNARYKLK